MKREDADVPCGGCTLCCRGGEAIILHPEEGDKIENYGGHVIFTTHPLTKKPCFILKHKAIDGSCTYLGPTGCGIYHKRPSICRTFDCRKFAKVMTPALAAAMKAKGMNVEKDAVFNRGKELLAAEGGDV